MVQQVILLESRSTECSTVCRLGWGQLIKSSLGNVLSTKHFDRFEYTQVGNNCRKLTFPVLLPLLQEHFQGSLGVCESLFKAYVTGDYEMFINPSFCLHWELQPCANPREE